MRDRPRILFVEDEQSISAPFSKALEREGFEPHVAATAARALQLQEQLEPDLILLDLHLPDGDGRDVCRTIRARSGVPIIILTARGTETDRIVGLELGADDYVVKPFSGPEVIARMRAVLRRVQPAEPWPPEEPITIGGAPRRPRRPPGDPRRQELQLSRKEFDLLARARPQRRQGRHPRGPDGPRLGRELVRQHEDARRPRPLAPRQARRDGRQRHLPPDRPRRRLPLPRTRRSEPPHPTAAGAGLRPAAGDRRARGAARAQPARPRQCRGAVAGPEPGRGRGRHRLRPARPARRAAPDRGHDRPVLPRPRDHHRRPRPPRRRLRRPRPARRRLQRPPGDRRRPARPPLPGPAALRHARRGDPRHRRAGPRRRAPPGRRADHPERRGRRPRHPHLDLRPRRGRRPRARCSASAPAR